MTDWNAILRAYLPEMDSSLLPEDADLPIFPRIVSDFVRKADDPNSELRQVASILETDTNLTCELLKNVNSASLGRRFRASSVLQALSSLGLRRSKLFVMTAAVQSSMSGLPKGLIDINEFWNVNLERALFAREVAKSIGADPDVSYTGAMLQDFLLPFLTTHFRKEYTDFLDNRNSKSPDLILFERARFSCNHATLAAGCLRDWNFPEELVCAVLLHHISDKAMRKADLQDTEVYAVSASSMLPDSLNQNPSGIERLIKRDKDDKNFDLFGIIEKVDEQIEEINSGRGNRTPLMDRIEAQVSNHLTQSVSDSISTFKRVGNYTLEEIIGRGGMGVVYKARHDMLKRPAAVKLIHSDQLSEKSIDQFEQEVQLTSQLEHPNTISIYDYGRTNEGIFFYAMEHVDGMTLKQLVQIYGAQPAGRVIQILSQVCGSLEEAHQLGIIHRDVKPENVLISTRGGMCDVVKVFDFGLSKDLESDKADSNTGLTGTPLYLAPEAIDSPSSIDQRSDIYSVGSLGYYLLTGQTVFTGNGIVDICLKQVQDEPPSPSKRLGESIEPMLEQLIMQCLKKSPENRPHSADYLAMSLLQTPEASSWDQLGARQWWETYKAQKENGELAVEAAELDCSSPTIITS